MFFFLFRLEEKHSEDIEKDDSDLLEDPARTADRIGRQYGIYFFSRLKEAEENDKKYRNSRKVSFFLKTLYYKFVNFYHFFMIPQIPQN